MSRWALVLLVAGASAGLAGCSGPDPGSNPVFPDPESSDNTPLDRPFSALDHPEQVPVLAREHLGENPEMTRITLTDNGFSMVVRDPVKRENLDQYSYYAGEWSSDPVSVTMSDIASFDKVTFTLGAVNWKAIPRLMDQAYDGLDLEGENITAVSIDRLAGQKPRIYIGVNGLRGSGRLLANADGTDVEVTRN